MDGSETWAEDSLAERPDEMQAVNYSNEDSKSSLGLNDMVPSSDVIWSQFIYGHSQGGENQSATSVQVPRGTALYDNFSGSTLRKTCEASESNLKGPMLDVTGHSFDAAGTYLSDVTFPWDASLDFMTQYSASAEYNNAETMPVLTESSTPISFASSQSPSSPDGDFATDIQ